MQFLAGLTVLAKCGVGGDASHYVKRDKLLSSSGGDGSGGYGGSSYFNQYDEIGILMILIMTMEDLHENFVHLLLLG